MSGKWDNRLNQLLEEKNATHNTVVVLCVRGEAHAPTASKNSRTPKNRTDKTDKTPSGAESLGLAATWADAFGFISMHDPTTGEWWDVPWKDAPEWAKWEARKRKELYSGFQCSRPTSHDKYEPSCPKVRSTPRICTVHAGQRHCNPLYYRGCPGLLRARWLPTSGSTAMKRAVQER